MGVIVSVNVGLPQDVAWQGRTVRTAVWKTPVTGRVFARRLNLDGDGQGDLRGHGGEQRAIMVYQLDSYRYWANYLGRSDLVAGNFGENLTVEGLADNEVCIGDRFRIGGAIVEVSQPRDTCYRVGIRLNRPEIAALLVAHHRPGFYFRVIQEGEIGAGDRVEKLSDGPERMTVAEIDALLYSAEHPLEALRRAVRIPALSLDWQGSMQALLDRRRSGRHNGQRRPRARRVGAPCVAWLPPGCGRCFARGKRGRPIVRVRRRRWFAAATGTTRPIHHGPHEAEPGCSRRHAKLFAVRSARDPQLSDWRQERARPRKRLSPPKRPGRQSPGDQRSAWLVHARRGCDSRRPYQRRCRRHADVGDVACCGCYKRRGVAAGLVAAFSPRPGAPFVRQGGGRSARGAPCVPSLRDLQSARAGRHARTGLRSTRPSFARAAPRVRGSPGRRFLSVWSARLPRGFPERPGGMGHSLAQGPCRSVRACADSHAGHRQRRRGLAASS